MDHAHTFGFRLAWITRGLRPADLKACDRAFRAIEAALDQPAARAMVR